MPLIFREKGYEFSFVMFDLGEPLHVHVRSGSKQAKFWVDALAVAWTRGYRPHEINEIERIIRAERSVDPYCLGARKRKKTMNQSLITVNTHPTHPHNGHSRAVAVPITIPDLSDVRKLAARLHATGHSYHEHVWGWEVTYEPELNEEAAEVEVPDGKGGYKTQIMPLWTPASFAIGESAVWFFSLLWEYGVDQEPVAFLDDRNLVEKTWDTAELQLAG